MTLSRPTIILSVVALGVPVLLFLTPLGDVTPAPIFLLVYGLTLLFEPFAAVGCLATALTMTCRQTGSPADRERLFVLGLAFGIGWLLFVMLLLASVSS